MAFEGQIIVDVVVTQEEAMGSNALSVEALITPVHVLPINEDDKTFTCPEKNSKRLSWNNKITLEIEKKTTQVLKLYKFAIIIEKQYILITFFPYIYRVNYVIYAATFSSLCPPSYAPEEN